MAKGSATEKQLGSLHSLLAKVMGKSLDKDMIELSIMDLFADFDFSTADPEDPAVAELVTALSKIRGPNPAMLSAVAKFLKDNDIGMDSEEVETLNATQRRLEDMRKRREQAGLRLVDVPAVGS